MKSHPSRLTRFESLDWEDQQTQAEQSSLCTLKVCMGRSMNHEKGYWQLSQSTIAGRIYQDLDCCTFLVAAVPNIRSLGIIELPARNR